MTHALQVVASALPDPQIAERKAESISAPPPVSAEAAAGMQPMPVPATTVDASAQATGTTGEAPKRGISKVKRALLWAGAALGATAMVVLAARGVTTLPGVPEFLEKYPGAYALPTFVEDGFPAWARWTHFLNLFFLVLIVRSGLLVRYQQKPSAYFTSKRTGTKSSIFLWLHTSIDVLWLLNGAIFVVLMFASGHWARIVPTSWEVIPNAISAALQYLTLEWPVEHGWVNYNSLQQLMYFTVVFIAAPLATVSGLRMSQWWPAHAGRLNKVYPAALARAVHFPVMLFFVVFVIVHVVLVFATGALRNLNHMFAGTDLVNWVGFAWFAVGMLVTALVTWAARPMILAPIARLFGAVSER